MQLPLTSINNFLMQSKNIQLALQVQNCFFPDHFCIK